jgi:hypothetical protein
MPSHPNDTQLIPSILHTLTQQITRNSTYQIILCGNFNRDIALIGRIQNSNTQPPQQPDYQWRNFTQTLGFTYVPTNTSYIGQGGFDYIHTSLIDGYFTKSLDNISYTSQTNIDFQHNSDHFPVSLFLPNNTILARPPPPPTPTPTQPRLLNPIPQNKLDLFNNIFFSTHSTKIENLTNLLQEHTQLTNAQWQEIYHSFEEIT